MNRASGNWKTLEQTEQAAFTAACALAVAEIYPGAVAMALGEIVGSKNADRIIEKLLAFQPAPVKKRRGILG